MLPPPTHAAVGFIKHPCELEALLVCDTGTPRRLRGTSDAAPYILDKGMYTWRARVECSKALFLNAVPAHSRHARCTRQCQGWYRPLSRRTTIVGVRQLRLPRGGSFLATPTNKRRNPGKPRLSKYIGSGCLFEGFLVQPYPRVAQRGCRE